LLLPARMAEFNNDGKTAQSDVIRRDQAEHRLAQCIAHVFKTIWQNAHLSWKEKREFTIGSENSVALLGNCPIAYVMKNVDELVDFFGFEQSVRTLWAHICVWRTVKGLNANNAAIR
jgi:hypothetical protein